MRVPTAGRRKALPLRYQNYGSQIDFSIVGSRTYAEVEPGFFRQVDGPRTLTYRTDDQGQVTQIVWGQFVYFKVPWYQTASNQLLMAGISLLLMLTAAFAWMVDWFIRRRRSREQPSRWVQVARWTAVGLGILNIGLLAWFFAALLGFAESFVFPAATMVLITRLWWLSVPMTVALLVFIVMVWQRHTWRLAWRLHYTLVTVASVAFVLFLMNWNLLAR